jgi:membrane-bound metal-dependent hydrolase YbcI (DUF457 family)
MNTPSHFLMTAALDKALPRIPIHQKAFLIGSIAPDMPLWILSGGGVFYYHLILGWSMRDTLRVMFVELYFHNPFWLALHNFLHAPLLLLLGIVLVWRKRRNIGSIYRFLFWFCIACLFHSIVDIFTHANDGPLLFFPFDWGTRFHSSVSYWDPRYHGQAFGRFEKLLDSVLLVYLLRERVCYLVHRLASRATTKL